MPTFRDYFERRERHLTDEGVLRIIRNTEVDGCTVWDEGYGIRPRVLFQPKKIDPGGRKDEYPDPTPTPPA